MIDQGLADPERLASIGWSNGGILTAELITRTDRFKAASVGAADVEWISDWANVAFGASFDNYYFGGPPWEATETYLEKSPFFRLTEVTTPTIIYTGTEDTNVPPHQSWSLFRALQQIDKAPARLVLFPGEPHGLRKISDQRRKMREDLDWLDRYVFAPGGQEELEAIRPGTLLAGLVDRAGAAAAASGAVGVEEDGVLVPETVPFAGQTVGRFEVTRAQWAAFDPAAEVGAGRGEPAGDRDLVRAREGVRGVARRADRAGVPAADGEGGRGAGKGGHGREGRQHARPVGRLHAEPGRRGGDPHGARREARRVGGPGAAAAAGGEPAGGEGDRGRAGGVRPGRQRGRVGVGGGREPASRSGRARTGRRMRGGMGGSRGRRTWGCGWWSGARRASRRGLPERPGGRASGTASDLDGWGINGRLVRGAPGPFDRSDGPAERTLSALRPGPPDLLSCGPFAPPPRSLWEKLGAGAEHPVGVPLSRTLAL